MRVSKCLGLLAIALLLGGPALAQAPYVYVSNPAGGQIVKVTDAGNTLVLFENRKIEVGDLVIGPDDLLYACVPDDGLVFRFHPADPNLSYPLSLNEVEKVYEGPLALQCGWFSDKGDLFTTGRDDAVWVFEDLVPLDGSSSSLPATPTLKVEAEGFEGQGITQAAPGDLLYVSQATDEVWKLSFDPIFRFSSADPLYPNLPAPLPLNFGPDPVGIARSGNDTIFVAASAEVSSHWYNAVDEVWVEPCPPYTFDGQEPQFLQFSSDGFLYVASLSKKAATLWKIDLSNPDDFCGDLTEIITFERPDWNPSMSGVAVPRTARDGYDTQPAENVYVDYDKFYSFKDHAYRLEFLPDDPEGPDPTCAISQHTATETLPSCLTTLISNYTVVGDDQLEDQVTGVPVTYAGDGGMAQLYTIRGTCDATVTDIQHGISAFTAFARNPRIVRCGWTLVPETGNPEAEPPPDPVDPVDPCDPPESPDPDNYQYKCQLIDLELFFPFNGAFPDDADLRGSRSSGASAFSEYFFADIQLAGDNDGNNNTPACFCGWEDPLPDIYSIDPSDPSAGLPSYNSGSAVPVKFRAAIDYDELCGTATDPCDTGAPDGYLTTGGKVLLAVARIFDGDDNPVYEPKRPNTTGSSYDGIYFGNPTAPSTPFHYNLDTSGYLSGVYQAVAVAITDNFEAQWTYFAIR